MDTGTKTYKVDKHKQLIPLNGSTVNFSCFFEVKSKENKPFNVAIVEQGELKPKQYKLVDNGYINGQIESDGQLKTYFLILKSQQPCECDVRVILKPKEISGDLQPPLHTPVEHDHLQPRSQHHDPQTDPTTVMVVSNQESYFQMKYILGISIAIIIVYLLYKFRRTIFSKFETKDILAPSMSESSF